MKWKCRAIAVLLAPLSSVSAQESKPAETAATVVLEGQVVDLRGEPVPMSKMQVFTWQDPDRALAQAMCDGEGFFKIARVPKADLLIVRARCQGYCQGEGYVWSEPVPVRIALHDAVTVRGALRNRSGAPVAGAIVRASLIARISQGVWSDGVTDGGGRFTMTGVPLGLVRFQAVVPGEGLAELRTLIRDDAEVTLSPGGGPTTSLAMVVQGMPATDLKKLRLQFSPYDQGHLREFPPPWHQPVFNAEGRLDMQPVPDLKYDVRPLATGFAFAPSFLEAQAGKGPHLLQFTATPVGSTALQCPACVRDGEGMPVAGVRLTMRLAGGGDAAEAISGADGKLTFASTLAAGTEVVVGSLDERFVLDQDKTRVPSGWGDRRSLVWHECKVDPAITLDLRVAPACSIKGRVLLTDGRPAPFVEVRLVARTDTLESPFAYATTDRNGKYSFQRRHHLGENARVTVESWCGAAASEPFAMAEAGTHVSVPELELAAAATVEGTVVDTDRKPVPGVRVWLCDWDLARSQKRTGTIVEVITDRRGRYRFVGAPLGGTYVQLLVTEDHPRGNAVEPFEIEAGRTYTFDLQVERTR